ncbi:MAG: TonB-dependent receptor [Alphaproteobacteria bacterium]|nr:TonB-dependent receptor [Alphaproteobacteria bacterium]
MSALLALCGVALADGQLSGLVFEERTGAPLAGEAVLIDGETVRSDADGQLSLSLPAGEHVLRVGALEQPFVISDDEVTELLLTLGPSGPRVQLEQPALLVKVDQDATPGTLRGIVLHGEEGTPIVGARVYVLGSDVEGRTDEDGVFELTLPSGAHSLTIMRSGYATLNLDQVEVQAERTSERRFELVPAGLELADYRITAPRIEGGSAELLAERKDASAVTDVMGAEDMARTGASDAAAALGRVTGVTVVGGKYVYVRGMGERYSSTLLNGSSLPSPEPERRVVPLDLFPATMLEAIVVQKSYTPDMPAEFGGGVLQLRTRGAPAEFTANVSVKGGLVAGSTFQEGQFGYQSDTDWLGFDDGSRDMPQIIQDTGGEDALLPRGMFSETGYTNEELEEMGEAFPNRWSLSAKTVPLDKGVSTTIGGSTNLGEATLGGLVAATWSDGWDLDEYSLTTFTFGDGTEQIPNDVYQFSELKRSVRFGGIGAAELAIGDNHSVELISVINRNTDHMGRYYEADYDDTDIRVWRDQWVERQLLFEQVLGHHELPSQWQVDWRYALSLADRDEPMRREWRRDYRAGQWMLSDRPEGNEIFFSTLDDINHDGGLDLTLPFTFQGVDTARVKVGGWAVSKQRTVSTRRFKFQESDASDALRAADSLDWFTKETIGEAYVLRESTTQSDDYGATQKIFAGYAMGELPLFEDALHVVGGLRVEYSDQDVSTFELYSESTAPAVADLATVDVLPALNATLALADDMQLRAGYGKTLSRPDFRELSEVPYADVTGGRVFKGNSELNRAILHNFDLRWELYPSLTESVSVALFYKRFIDPIEQTLQLGAERVITYTNAPSANNYGVEFEWRKNMPAPVATPWLQDFYTAGNLSLIRSRVQLGEDADDVRALQGQSPWVLNLQLGYDNPDSGSTLTGLFNVFGPRISQVGSSAGGGIVPNTYELPAPTLDLVMSQGLPKGFNLKLKASNLLNAEIITDGAEYTSIREGRAFSVGLSWGI